MEKLTSIQTLDAVKQSRWDRATGRNYVRISGTERCHIALNCYEPGVNDEMHCHPGSDHTFFVVEGECTIKGLKSGEEHNLTQHQGAHIAAGYFYQLNNSGKDRLILYQVSTEANPRPKKTKVIYGIDTSLKEHLLGRLSEPPLWI